jgi:hypothetical protein
LKRRNVAEDREMLAPDDPFIQDGTLPLRASTADEPAISADDFFNSFGEDIQHVLLAAKPVTDVKSMEERLNADIASVGGPIVPDPELQGTIGTTMFDAPGSEDNTITVLLPRQSTQTAPSQSLVRIRSRKGGDGKTYLRIVTTGPFAEPDSLRADSHLLVTVATRGGDYQPPYHGRIQVAILVKNSRTARSARRACGRSRTARSSH